MDTSIILVLIEGAITLIGIVLSAWFTRSKVAEDIKISQAVMGTKMDNMGKDLAEHNHYAKMFSETMPVVQEQIKVINHRLTDVETEIKDLRERKEA